MKYCFADTELSQEVTTVVNELDCGRSLQDARRAIRDGELGRAQCLLMEAASAGSRDAAFLNLVGVVHEVRGRQRMAQWFYRQAVASDPEYAPAWHNFWRTYEMEMFGQSRRLVALDDGISLPDGFERRAVRSEA